MTVHELVAAARHRLCQAGITTAEAAVDAEVLARQALGWDRAQYLCRRQEGAPASFEAAFRELIERRERREPVSLITGRREFWGLDFIVTPDVLAPRPETELLVEEALAFANGLSAWNRSVRLQPDMGTGEGATVNRSVRLQRDEGRGGALSPAGGEGSAREASAGEGERRALSIVDVGTGSGCLAIALARELPDATVAATDVSPAALDVARMNAAHHSVEDRIRWHATRFLEGIDRPVDLIVSNPPYVRDAEALPPEVGWFEPAGALFAGPDGLDAIRELLRQAAACLAPGGALLFELGAGQADAVRELTASHPELVLERIRDDLGGIPRVAIVRRMNP